MKVPSTKYIKDFFNTPRQREAQAQLAKIKAECKEIFKKPDVEEEDILDHIKDCTEKYDCERCQGWYEDLNEDADMNEANERRLG
jgi:hypothetical protein